MKISALIPVKSFRNAKQRLSGALDAAARERLAETMFRDVLGQVVGMAGLTETVVVTCDESASRTAASMGARVLREPGESGETDAVNYARSELQRAGCEAILILPGDLPLLERRDLEDLLAQVTPEQAAPYGLLVPSHDRLGTNALLLAPPDLIPLRFGHDSFNYHMSQLAARGLPLRFWENERLALDIDTPRDLERFLAAGRDGETYRTARKLLEDQRTAHAARREIV